MIAMRRYTPARMLSGVGLVELMIALVLGALITAGTISLFSANRQSFRLQDNLSQTQESGSFVLDFLARDIRRAGYPGPGVNQFAAFDVSAAATRNDVSDPRSRTINGAAVTVNFVDDQLAIVFKPDGFLRTDCAGSTGDGGVPWVDAAGVTTLPPDDYISNRYWVREIDPIPASGPDRELVCQGFRLRTELNAAGIRQVTATTPVGQPQALVSGIESFQVMYGIDTTFDRETNACAPNPALPTMYVQGGLLPTAANFNRKDFDGGAATGCQRLFPALALVRAVRVALLVRTPADVDAIVPATREYTLLDRTLSGDSAAAAPAVFFPPINDGRVRRLFMTTVALRNAERGLR